MSSISLTYPTTWLSIEVNVYKLPEETLHNTWIANEVGSTWVYIYTFTEDGISDYTYIAKCSWYRDLGWAVFNSSSGSWSWSSVADIWNAPIESYSSVVWSFWQKFSQYGWVSHIIDRSTFDEESKKEIEAIRKSFKDATDEIQKSIANIKVPQPQVISEWKTTVIKYNDKEQKFIQEFITETIPLLADKIDNLIPLMQTYEELLIDYDNREKEYIKVLEDIINNK